MTREEPISDTVRKGSRELRLSNLDKLFWPDEGITKGDLLRYYQQVADTIVPHLAGRPFTMRRYPDGAAGKAFFQKDAPKHMPDWIPRYRALVSKAFRQKSIAKWEDEVVAAIANDLIDEIAPRGSAELVDTQRGWLFKRRRSAAPRRNCRRGRC